jgi:hypothetical protein
MALLDLQGMAANEAAWCTPIPCSYTSLLCAPEEGCSMLSMLLCCP